MINMQCKQKYVLGVKKKKYSPTFLFGNTPGMVTIIIARFAKDYSTWNHIKEIKQRELKKQKSGKIPTKSTVFVGTRNTINEIKQNSRNNRPLGDWPYTDSPQRSTQPYLRIKTVFALSVKNHLPKKSSLSTTTMSVAQLVGLVVAAFGVYCVGIVTDLSVMLWNHRQYCKALSPTLQLNQVGV
jgi:hypothetical protein